MILSVSRRTDIPSYYSEWFINRLKEGYVQTRNPFNPNQVSRVEVTPDSVDCIVFWTKDPLSMMDKLVILDAMGYHYYFQFTLTPYGHEMERNLRDKSEIIDTFRCLSDRLGKERVFWRYDPIILNNRITQEYHKEHFEKLCSKLAAYTSSCTISFVDLYKRLSKPTKENIIREIGNEEMLSLAKAFSEISRSFGMEIRACCEKTDFTIFGIKPAACIDKDVVERVCGHSIEFKKDKNQRPGCGCVKSVDIGAYNTCRNGCIYCYANHSEASILKNCTRHREESDILIG